MPGNEEFVAEVQVRVAKLRSEYSCDGDAFSALASIVVKLAGEVPFHVRAAFDWWDEG